MSIYNPSGSDNVHVDEVLTQISVAWPNEGFVGERLFPVVNVRKQSDKYYVFGRESWVPEATDIRAPGTEANEIPGLAVSTDTYYAQEHSLQIAVTDEERQNADSPLSPDRDGTELVTSKVLLGRELAMRDLVTVAANYAPTMSRTYVDGSSSQWNNATTSTPIADIRRAKRAMHAGVFLEPNVAVIPYRVMSALEDHDDLIDRIKYSERAILTPDLIAALLGLSNVIVPGAGYSATNPGQAISLSYIWDDDVILAYVPPRPGLKIPAFAYEFNWGYGGNTPQVVDRWREMKRKCDIVRVSRRYDLKIVAKDDNGKALCGYLFKNVLDSDFS